MEASIESLEAELNNDSIMMVPKDRAAKENDLSRKSRLIRLLHQMKGRHDAKMDAQAWDDVIQTDTLYLCKGKEYEFNFRSKDVIHSAYFPHFRAQMNTVPGMVTRFKFIPNKTTAEMRVERAQEDFNFILMCNKICGGAHYKMKMMVVVMEEEDYNKWWDVKKTMTFKSKYFASEELAEEPATEAAAPAEEAAQADTTATAMN
jgi:cytochrome c oxidase subunit 2